MPRMEQRSFSGGEISPALYGRTDIRKYQSSVALMKNWFPRVHGGASTRAGFEYIGNASDVGLAGNTDSSFVRLIKFQFNTEQNYILCFGDEQMRVIRNGEFVLEAEQTIVSITQADPAVVEVTGHGYVEGDEVYLSDITGMVELNDRLLIVGAVTTDTFELRDVDSTNYTAFSSGNAAALYQISTPYGVSDDLTKLKYTQSADVMILTHPDFPPYELLRTAGEPSSQWTLQEIDFGSTARPPIQGTVTTSGTASTADDKTYGYVVTAVSANGSESVASNAQTITMDAQSSTFGAKLVWNQITGATQADPVVITIADHGYSDLDQISIDGIAGMTELNGNNYKVQVIDEDTFGLYEDDGLETYTSIDGTGFTAYSSGGYAKPKNGFFNVYKLNSVATNIYGYIGQSDTGEFTDFNLGPDMSVTPPTNNNPFEVDGEENNPFCTTYHQQRLWFGGVRLSPQTIFASKNFDLSNPVRSDDSIETTLATREVNQIRHLVSIGPLIALTSGGPWRIDGDADGVITPTAINTKFQGGRGCSDIEPVIVGDTVLFIQNLSGKIRDLAYEFETDKYTGNDLTIYAEHLFYSYQILDWCYCEEPNSLVWCVRSDGVLLSLAYLKEQDVWGWSQHETNGFVESVESISEGNEDILYAVIRREVGGVTRRYVERMHERRFTDINDAFCVDAGLTYDGASTDRIIGLEHLEGLDLVALADGQVIMENLTVSNGEVTLPYEAEVVHIGLPYDCLMQSLDLTIPDQTLRTRKTAVPRVGLLMRESRGVSAGEAEDSLYEFDERIPAYNYGQIPSFTGIREYQVDITWQESGSRIWIKQGYPLPATVLSMTPEIELGGD